MKLFITSLLLGLSGLVMAPCVQAQTTNPNNPNGVPPKGTPELTAPGAAAVNAATGLAQQPLATAVSRAAATPNLSVAPRPPAVVQAGTGAAVSAGVRVLKAPGACTPKTNSLDCVQDSSQAGQGANVSGRVRNSVIGEVGTGQAITEGAGGAQRQQACTPKPGQLTCAP
jgi:hypothetical protein